MSVVTAIRPLRESFILLGGVTTTRRGGPHGCAHYRRGERGARRAAVVLHMSWAGRTLWAHDASHASIAACVPIMGPGATVGPVGTRVPMDLSAFGPVRTGMNIPPSPRCERLGRPRGKEPPRAAKCTESPREASRAVLPWGDVIFFWGVNPNSSRGPPGLLKVASVRSKVRRAHMAAAVGIVDRKSTRLNSSHITRSRMPSSA